MRTYEYGPQGKYQTDAAFRSYGSPQESSADWSRLMRSPLYRPVLEAEDLDTAIDAVARAGYATDPEYARKLKSIKPTTPEQQAFYIARISEAKRSGMDDIRAELAARQAALESNWGRSAPGGNLYGIKAQGKPLQVAQAGRADISPGLLGGTLMQPMEDENMQPYEQESPFSGLLSDPMFLTGASLLSQAGGQSGAVGRGLLGGSMAYQKQQNDMRENMLRQQQIKAIQSPRSANITEYEYLRQMGVPHDQAMRYSFAGNAGYGERGLMMGNVPMVQVTRPDGTTELRQMTPDELGYRTKVIGEEAGTKTESEGLGKQRSGLRENINQFVLTAPSLIKQTDQLIADIEAGKYEDTGPISGRLKEYWSPEIADIQFKATEQVLQNLQITNLAPVTIKELELVAQLYAGAFKTPAQNVRILKYLNQRMKERMRRMRKLDQKLRSGGRIEDLPLWVDQEFEDFDIVAPLPDMGETTGAPGQAPAAAGSAIPPPPPGFTERVR